VEYLGTRSAPVDFFVVASAPAFFTFSSSGQGPAAALNEDGSVNTRDNGADPGSIVVLYATGQGVTTPDGVDGLLAASVYPKPVLPVRVTVAGQDGEVLYAGAAPQLAAGLLQVNVRLPSDLAPGSAIPIALTVGDNASQPGVTIFTKLTLSMDKSRGFSLQPRQPPHAEVLHRVYDRPARPDWDGLQTFPAKVYGASYKSPANPEWS
jgi:uncharacterized protein (TIGR03437 family)